MMEAAGFNDVQKRGMSEYDNPAYEAISLYMAGVK
jgi:hypothetical protein